MPAEQVTRASTSTDAASAWRTSSTSETADSNILCFQLHILTATRKIVGTLTVDFLGRESARHLFYLTNELLVDCGNDFSRVSSVALAYFFLIIRIDKLSPSASSVVERRPRRIVVI